jgi:D-alanyl-D-alanine carboxypeptidase
MALARTEENWKSRICEQNSIPGLTNKLLGRVEGVDGIKTGYTRMSGFNLLTSARAGGRQIVAVVLGGRSGGARDRLMASLVDANLGRAYAGSRTAPLVGEAPGRPAAVAAASADTEVEETTTAAISPKAATLAPAPARRQIVPGNARPVVASALGGSATTPSSSTRASLPAPVATPAAMRPPADIRATSAIAPRSEPRPVRVEAETKTQTRGAVAPGWQIQLGATDDESKAQDILNRAKGRVGALLGKAEPFTEKVSKGGAVLYRARFSGFDAADAQQACRSLQRNGFSCFAIKG